MAKEYGELEQLVNDVTNLDTARMTLRWALERLNSIEKEKADLKKNLTLAEETSKRLQLKEASLSDAYTSRSKTLEEKEDFYTKLEATMSLLGEGKLDIQQLLKKEAKLDSLRHSLENEYQDKFDELDRNQRAVIERWNSRLLEVESQYSGRLAEAQVKYDGLRSNLETEYQGRLSSLQTSFKTREKELSERIGQLENSVHLSEANVETRRAALEAEYLSKKRETEENYRKLSAMLESGYEDKLRAMDNDHAAQVRSLESSWQIERARLLEEQRVRDDQFAAAQARIQEIEVRLGSQQEAHHNELLTIITEKETAFRAQLAGLEKEKTAKEAAVKELVSKLEKKTADWEAERARLEAEFGRRLEGMDASVRARAGELEQEYAVKKEDLKNALASSRSEFEAEFKARLEMERQALTEEKSRLTEEKRLREEALARNAEKVKELENALAAGREEHHKELMERIRAGEASFRGKMAAFEAEKQAYNETINNLTAGMRRNEAAVLEEKKKIAAEYEAKAAIHGELLARTEAAFEEKRRAYDEKIAALSGRLEEAAKASALETENFKNEIARVSAATNALAEERAAGIRAEYEARKAELEREFSARYSDRLKSMEAEKARVNEALAEREGQLKAAYAKAAELDGAIAGLRRAASEEKAALSREYSEEMKNALKAAEESARAREAELFTDINVLREELTEKDCLLSAEREKLVDELAKASAQAHSRTEERAAAVRAEYEARLAAHAEYAEKTTSGLKAALAGKGALLEKAGAERAEAERVMRADFENRVSELGAQVAARVSALEAEHSARREKLDAEAAARAEALNAEAAARMEFERGNWQAERSRFERALEETSGNFRAAQKEMEDLNASLRKAAEANSAREAVFNRELMETKANFDRELAYRVKDAVAVQTAHLMEALGAAKTRQEEFSAALEEKENSILALRAEALAMRRDYEDRLNTAGSEAVSARRQELDELYAARKLELEKDAAALREELTGGYEAKETELVRRNDLREAQLEAEKADLEAGMEKLRAQSAAASAKAAEVFSKMMQAAKEHQEEMFRLKEAHASEVETKTAAAVEAATRSLAGKTALAEDGLAKAREEHKKEIAALEKFFAETREKMAAELESSRNYAEVLDFKIQEIEKELGKVRQNSAAEFIGRMTEQDDQITALEGKYKARQERLANEAEKKIREIVSSCDAKMIDMQEALKAKEELIQNSEEFWSKKQSELDKNHADFNLRISKFNEELFSQKQALNDKEKTLNEVRLKLEGEYQAKCAEMEVMKAELSRTIVEYKNRK